MTRFDLWYLVSRTRADALCLLKLLPRESADAARLQRAYSLLSVAADCHTPDRGGRTSALFDVRYPGTLYYAAGVDFPPDRLPLAPGPLVTHAIGVLDMALTINAGGRYARQYARKELSAYVRRQLDVVAAVCREVADAAGVPHGDYDARCNSCE